MELQFLDAVRKVASWSARGFVVQVDTFELDLETKKWEDQEKGLTSMLYGPAKFAKLMRDKGTAKWNELLPLWIQQFLWDVRLVQYLAEEQEYGTKNGTAKESVPGERT